MALSLAAANDQYAIGALSEGPRRFNDVARRIDGISQKMLTQTLRSLERDGLVRLGTSVGKDRWVLNPYLLDENVVLVSIWNDKRASIGAWRMVVERRAPLSLAAIEAASAPIPVGHGRVVYRPSDELLEAIREGYREAAGLSGTA